jgi:hypothetical protein
MLAMIGDEDEVTPRNLVTNIELGESSEGLASLDFMYGYMFFIIRIEISFGQ